MVIFHQNAIKIVLLLGLIINKTTFRVKSKFFAPNDNSQQLILAFWINLEDPFHVSKLCKSSQIDQKRYLGWHLVGGGYEP